MKQNAHTILHLKSSEYSRSIFAPILIRVDTMSPVGLFECSNFFPGWRGWRPLHRAVLHLLMRRVCTMKLFTQIVYRCSPAQHMSLLRRKREASKYCILYPAFHHRIIVCGVCVHACVGACVGGGACVRVCV